MEKNSTDSKYQDLSVVLSVKKGHKETAVNLIQYSEDEEDANKFFTISEDKTARLWDLRVGGSVKMFSDAEMVTEDVSGLAYSKKRGTLYCSSENRVVGFDERQCKIISKSAQKRFRNEGVDEEISKLALTEDESRLIFIEDGCSINCLDSETLELQSCISGAHKAIPFALTTLNKGENGLKSKALKNLTKQQLRVVYTGGFDCCVNTSDLGKEKVEKSTDMNEILSKAVGVRSRTPALVYHIHANKKTNELLVSLETGHLMSLKSKNTGKLRFMIDAHAHKIIKSEYSQFDPKTIFTISDDMSWALWNSETRSLSKKIKLAAQPNTAITLNSSTPRVVIADVESTLKIYEIKQ